MSMAKLPMLCYPKWRQQARGGKLGTRGGQGARERSVHSLNSSANVSSMQRSTRDPRPSSDCSNANTHKIECILTKINRFPLLTALQVKPTFVWDDILIPYSNYSLPQARPEYRTRFLEEQREYLSKESQLVEILKPAGGKSPPHLRVIDIGKIFDIDDILGNGTFGEVLKAKLPLINRQDMETPSKFFAIKRFRKQGSGRDIETIVDSFLDERKNLKTSEGDKHEHIVSFHASFTDEVYLGFITSPVAEMTLKELLKKPRESNVIRNDERASLHNAFGCLLEAIRHLHEDLQMRHCDLKPSNILVCRLLGQGKHFRVRLCDLGTAHIWNSPQNMSTDENQRGTSKYKAPEVHQHHEDGELISHNRLVDIFSLGCIFLEMHTILRSKTLNQMAKAITNNDTKNFDDQWTYAGSLPGVRKWLGELCQDDDDNSGNVIVDRIKTMVSKDRKERKEARDHFELIRKFEKYVGDCCLKPPSTMPTPEPRTPPDPGSMIYGEPRPFKKCKISSREKGLNDPHYSAYKCLKDFHQGGEVEIPVDTPKDGEKWEMTRRIKITTSQAPHVEWLPAYYVQSAQTGCRVTVEWSDCDQMHQTQHGRQRASRFEKVGFYLGVASINKLHDQLTKKQVHYSSPKCNNLCMKIVFENESDAYNFQTLLLKEPFDENALFNEQIPMHKTLTVYKHEWKCSSTRSAENDGNGSHVVCSKHILQDSQSSRLEPLFVPNNFDFTLPLQNFNDHRYTKLVSKYLLVPEYRSNVRDRYEVPNDKGIYDSVELVWLRNAYPFDFDAGSQDDSQPQSSHVDFALPSLRLFLKSLTGWSPLVFFSATDVRHKPLWRSSKGPADVLCFKKDNVKRIAIRRKFPVDESTIEWVTATLEKSLLIEPSKLKMTLKLSQKGKNVALASLKATNGDAEKPMQQSEDKKDWIFTVNIIKGGAGNTEWGARNIEYALNDF
ncbi:hypothetical protein MMC29_000091 [Sticta canariensis]|nr:hypothetical protein [Sticta canariensis]